MQINDFLKECEKYLSDLEVLSKNKLLDILIEDIQNQPEILEQKPFFVIENYRSQLGFQPFKRAKKFSLAKFLFKSFIILFLILSTLTTYLIWQFTPIIKLDEKNNHIVILGGLIDINGQTGKVKIFDQVEVTKKKYKNELNMKIPMSSDQDEIIIQFNTAHLNLNTNSTSELIMDCTINSTPPQNIIKEKQNDISINLKEIQSSTCELSIPRDKKITMEGDNAQINIHAPIFDIFIESENSNVNFFPAPEESYKYNLEVKNGFVDSFNNSDSDYAFEININIQNGSINHLER